MALWNYVFFPFLSVWWQKYQIGKRSVCLTLLCCPTLQRTKCSINGNVAIFWYSLYIYSLLFCVNLINPKKVTINGFYMYHLYRQRLNYLIPLWQTAKNKHLDKQYPLVTSYLIVVLFVLVPNMTCVNGIHCKWSSSDAGSDLQCLQCRWQMSFK